jgi:hypothetical protein
VQVEQAARQLSNAREKFLSVQLTRLGALLNASVAPLKEAGTHTSTQGALHAGLQCMASDMHDVPLPKVPEGVNPLLLCVLII